jgi:sulfite reductase alpha subunit-like flavoprotein
MILYATETGKSLGFAKQLAHVFSKAFKPDVMCMKDYDIGKMEFEDLILVGASIFGSGDPPDKGEKFCKSLKNRFFEHRNSLRKLSRISQLDLPPESRLRSKKKISVAL